MATKIDKFALDANWFRKASPLTSLDGHSKKVPSGSARPPSGIISHAANVVCPAPPGSNHLGLWLNQVSGPAPLTSLDGHSQEGPKRRCTRLRGHRRQCFKLH